MTKKQAIKLFEEKKVRTVWDDEKEQIVILLVKPAGLLGKKKVVKV